MLSHLGKPIGTAIFHTLAKDYRARGHRYGNVIRGPAGNPCHWRIFLPSLL